MLCEFVCGVLEIHEIDELIGEEQFLTKNHNLIIWFFSLMSVKTIINDKYVYMNIYSLEPETKSGVILH